MVGIGVETTNLPEVVLDRGRRLELLLAVQETKGVVLERIDTAFAKAFNAGNFQVPRLSVNRNARQSAIIISASNLLC